MKFLTYQNPKLGFRSLYPSGWQVLEENPDRVVIFNSFGNVTVRIIVDNVTNYLDKNTSSVKNMTAHDYALNEINVLRGVASNVRVTDIAVGPVHVPGWRVDYALPGHYVIDINLVTNGKRFTISYVVTAPKAPEALATIQTMLDSFQIIK